MVNLTAAGIAIVCIGVAHVISACREYQRGCHYQLIDVLKLAFRLATNSNESFDATKASFGMLCTLEGILLIASDWR